MSGLLIYDGDCGFCTSTAAWLIDQFPPEVRVEPWQSLDISDFGLTETDVQSSSWWVDSDGATFGGALGIGRALKITEPRWTRLAGGVIDLAPVRPLAKAVYRVIVRYRHKLPGSTDACQMRYDLPTDTSR